MKPFSSRHALPVRVAELLREELAAGRWGGALPGERRLCVQLGVSRPTLRKALAQLRRKGLLRINQGRASKPTRRAGKDRSSAGAQKVIVLTPESHDRLPASVVYTFDELRGNLAEAGLRLEVRTFQSSHRDSLKQSLVELQEIERPSAYVLYQAERPVHRWFRERGLPCVVLGTQDANFPLPAIDLDQRATCRHAAHTLVRTGMETRQLVLVLPVANLPGSALAREGFEDALGKGARTIEVPVEPQPLSAAMDRLFANASERKGLIFTRAGQAVAALGHLGIRRRLRVPEEVAIISLADDPFFRHVQPALARYRRDEPALARQISSMVIRAATGVELPARMSLLMPEFIPGETVFSRA